MRSIKMHNNVQLTQRIPDNRLHTVEEFIDKLEQAVLKKL
jgi:hypothetical protein